MELPKSSSSIHSRKSSLEKKIQSFADSSIELVHEWKFTLQKQVANRATEYVTPFRQDEFSDGFLTQFGPNVYILDSNFNIFRKFKIETPFAHSCAISNDCSLLAIQYKLYINLYKTRDGSLLKKIKLPRYIFYCNKDIPSNSMILNSEYGTVYLMQFLKDDLILTHTIVNDSFAPPEDENPLDDEYDDSDEDDSSEGPIGAISSSIFKGVIYTGYSDGSFASFSLSTGKRIFQIKCHHQYLFSILPIINHSNSKIQILTGGYDHKLFLHDIQQLESVLLKECTDTIMAIVPISDSIYALGSGRNILFYNMTTDKIFKTIVCSGSIRSLVKTDSGLYASDLHGFIYHIV